MALDGSGPFLRSSKMLADTMECCSSSAGEEFRRNSLGGRQYDSLSESNVGFQLLKKAGWKEGTGLGVDEQGMVSPVATQLKLDKRGIGAESKAQRIKQVRKPQPEKQDKKKKKRSKAALRLAGEEAQREQQAFASEFFRQFWPENV